LTNRVPLRHELFVAKGESKCKRLSSEGRGKEWGVIQIGDEGGGRCVTGKVDNLTKPKAEDPRSASFLIEERGRVLGKIVKKRDL